MKLPAFAPKILALINPLPPVGGLEISDSALKFFLFRSDGKAPLSTSLRLPPGIVEAGKVKDRGQLVSALKKLHGDVARQGRQSSVILVLPAHTVYTQSFPIPLISDDRLPEAARLNLQMLSPMDFSKVYAGWQRVGERFGDGGQIELLGAFVEAAIVDQFTGALTEAGFMLAAVEFPALALTRFLAERAGAKQEESYLTIHVAGDGVSLMVLRGNALHFNHFHPWATIQEEVGGKQITGEAFRGFVEKEVQKVLNFYAGKWGGSVSAAFIVAPDLEKPLIDLLSKSFSMSVRPIATSSVPGIGPSWFVVAGAALRGLVARSRDSFVSLTNLPVQEEYRQARILHFVSVWGKVIITVAAFMILVFGVADYFVARRASQFVVPAGGGPEVAELEALTEKATAFNDLVASVKKARAETVAWSTFLSHIETVGAQVTFRKLSVAGDRVTIVGTAQNETSALAFRDRLATDPIFIEVNLPLEAVRANPDGTAEFTLTAKLRSN